MHSNTPPPSSVQSELLHESVKELTTQEMRVLSLALQELTCKEMAEQLHISPQTVEKHRKNILRKLNLKGKTAFRKAMRTLRNLLSQWQQLPEKYPKDTLKGVFTDEI